MVPVIVHMPPALLEAIDRQRQERATPFTPTPSRQAIIRDVLAAHFAAKGPVARQRQRSA